MQNALNVPSIIIRLHVLTLLAYQIFGLFSSYTLLSPFIHPTNDHKQMKSEATSFLATKNSVNQDVFLVFSYSSHPRPLSLTLHRQLTHTHTLSFPFSSSFLPAATQNVGVYVCVGQKEKECERKWGEGESFPCIQPAFRPQALADYNNGIFTCESCHGTRPRKEVSTQMGGRKRRACSPLNCRPCSTRLDGFEEEELIFRGIVYVLLKCAFVI